MAIDWQSIAALGGIPKVRPKVLVRDDKKRSDAKAWRKVKKAVDERAKDEAGEKRCFITGKRLQVTNTLDEWTFRDPAHIEARSKSKARKHEVDNVLAVSRGVHRLIDRSALFLLDKRGNRAKSVSTIDHVAWNRRMVAKGEEPCRIRKGLPVIELDKVKD